MILVEEVALKLSFCEYLTERINKPNFFEAKPSDLCSYLQQQSSPGFYYKTERKEPEMITITIYKNEPSTLITVVGNRDELDEIMNEITRQPHFIGPELTE